VRRIVLVLPLALGLLAAPLAADAQEPTKAIRIGLLLTGSPAAARHYLEALDQGLRELVYSDGQKVSFWARREKASIFQPAPSRHYPSHRR
jgi:hypothetical protein